MLSEIGTATVIRSMETADRAAVKEIITSVGNFNKAEIDCALELIDIYLQVKEQKDYRIAVCEDSDSGVQGYICWGPVPLTKGSYDIYWIATHPDSQGKGFGSSLIAYVENFIKEENGRLLFIETSSKESYDNTVRFYRRLGFKQTSKIRDFYDVGDDKLIFVKGLSRQGDGFANGTMEA
jgi:ribosomal protein S18 acetylase RimI-like enzyme